MWVLTELKENKSSFSRTIIYCRSLSSCGQYYYIHFSNKNGMVILSVVCTQCIIHSKICAFPGPYSTLKCPLCRSLLLNSTNLCMTLLASRVQDILQPLQIYHSKPFALVLRHTGYWPKKYQRRCDKRSHNYNIKYKKLCTTFLYKSSHLDFVLAYVWFVFTSVSLGAEPVYPGNEFSFSSSYSRGRQLMPSCVLQQLLANKTVLVQFFPGSFASKFEMKQILFVPRSCGLSFASRFIRC